MTQPTIRAAAIQLEAELGNIDANLELCERLADGAAADGAEWIALPEFFSSGVAYRPELAENAPPADGAPTQLLRDLARRHGAHVGGSTLVRDSDGHVRNAFFLAGPDGDLVGRHDKDLPTMWENALYVGGGDPGIIAAGDLEVGVALCWELMRSQTPRRLTGRVDVVMGGSGWWSIPPWPPRPLLRALERANARRATRASQVFARYVGSPVIHAAHSGVLSCPWPLLPATYSGHYEGGASICDERGVLLAYRGRDEGPGVAVADLAPRRGTGDPIPDRFWLQRRGAIATLSWTFDGMQGRRQYRRTGGQRLAGAVAEAVEAR